jgi:hypothetical protein
MKEGVMTRWILLALVLVAGVVGAEERATKRCWPDRAKAPCGQAGKLKSQPRGEAATGLYQNDLDQGLDAVEKADCSRLQIDLIRFMTDDANAACHGYRDYYRQRGRYAPTKK